ncbi:thioredoxin-like protein [Podospora australis]|uniref:Thioredoxin-like protein n=1 Tax=Podospora australis TaxID=1536484 RepID=A0AAN6WS35_9PEZI|nr:thioredoxin-like protein [Podospora australis]
MSDPIAIASPAQLEELVSSTKYVIVDFWAEWCGPCKAIAPLYAKLSKSYSVPGQLAFAKVDVDASSEIAQKYGVTAMPSFVFIVDGDHTTGIDVQGRTLGGGTVVNDGKLVMIRGADPRNLTVIAAELGQAAKEAAEGSAEAAPAAAEETAASA